MYNLVSHFFLDEKVLQKLPERIRDIVCLMLIVWPSRASGRLKHKTVFNKTHLLTAFDLHTGLAQLDELPLVAFQFRYAAVLIALDRELSLSTIRISFCV